MNPVVAHLEHRPISSKRPQHWRFRQIERRPTRATLAPTDPSHDHVVHEESGRGYED